MRKAGIASEIARLERLRDSHLDDQFAIRRKIGFGSRRLHLEKYRITKGMSGVAWPLRG
jgi:hypothetical protein